MNTSTENRSRGVGSSLVLALLWCVWQVVRLSLLGLLLIPAPLVRIVLYGFSLAVMLTAFLFEFGGTRPFPFFGMLAMSLGALGALALYEALIRVLSGGRN